MFSDPSSPTADARRIAVLAVGALTAALRPGRRRLVAGRRRRHRRPTRTRRCRPRSASRDLLGRMTLAEKIGQMTQAERVDIDADPSLITDATRSAACCPAAARCPTPNTPEAWADMVDRYQQAALDTRARHPADLRRRLRPRPRQPPGRDGLPAQHRPRRDARPAAGREDRPHHGRGDPRIRSAVGVRALPLRRPRRPVGPHLRVLRREPAAGEVDGDRRSTASRAGPGQLDRRRPGAGHGQALRRRRAHVVRRVRGRHRRLPDRPGHRQGHAQGVRASSRSRRTSPAIKQHHVGSVMPSFSSVDWTDDGLGNPVKMHANKELITGWLKGQQHFQGFVISDWRAIRQLPGDYRDQVEGLACNAGVDMFMEPIQAPNNPTGWDEFIPTLTDAGRTTARCSMAPHRRRGRRGSSPRSSSSASSSTRCTDRTHLDEIGSKAHHAVAREAVAESPGAAAQQAAHAAAQGEAPTVYVAGSNADNIGNQAGGWTLTWQGGSTNVIPGHTDPRRHREGRDAATSPTARTPPRRSRAGAVGVVVVGETPYAEGFGDVGGPQWAYDPGDNGVPRPAADDAAIGTPTRRRSGRSAPGPTSCTVLVVSGRPLMIAAGPAAPDRRAGRLVAARQRGRAASPTCSSAAGPFTGKLPVTWPRTVAQEPINVGDAALRPAVPLRVRPPHPLTSPSVASVPRHGCERPGAGSCVPC